MPAFLRRARERIGTILFIGIVAVSIAGIIQVPEDIATRIGGHPYIGGSILVGLMFSATIVAPVTLLPAIPMIAPILGPFVTAIACWAGWTLGAIVSFWIARYGGRPLISKFTTLQQLERFEERIPKGSHLYIIFALRLILPVDLLSYGLGLFSTVSIRTYACASGLGILWFSFAFSYLGYATATHNAVLFVLYGVASLIIFGLAFWYVTRTMKKSK
jgi:uncharacterized membrane protein YdjX (TVP38/TMEM64 family)